MTRAKPTSRKPKVTTQVLKGELFRLASIDLLGVSLSEGERVAFARRQRNAERLWFLVFAPQFEIHFKKRPTIELTWGETAAKPAEI